MNHLTLQNMNGCGHAMRGMAAPLIIEIDHGDLRSKLRHDMADLMPDSLLDQDGGAGLARDWAPWWTQMPPPRVPQSPAAGAAGKPRKGEAVIATTENRQPYPLTPSNDARQLKSPFTGKPLARYPVKPYPGSFPHTWTPYELLKADAGHEDWSAPTPPGWTAPPLSMDEERRAVGAAFPEGWAPEDAMAHDISGFGSLHAAFLASRGMGQIPGMVGVSAEEAASAAAAVTRQATAAQAAGASPDVVSSIVDFGSQAAAIYLQKRTIDQAKQAESQQRILLAQQAAASGVPFPRAAGGVGTGTAVGVGIGIAALAAAIALALSRKRGGRRR